MGRIRIKTADKIHNMVIMAFQQACDELGINNNVNTVQLNDCKAKFRYTAKITTYDYLDEYLRDKYCPKAGDFGDIDKIPVKALSDVFVKQRYKILEPVFEFDRNELTFHIYTLLDRIGLMYAYGATRESGMRDYIYLRIKEAFGYLLQFFEFLKKFDHIQPAVEAFAHWTNEHVDKSQEHLKTVYDGMSYIEYFKVVRQHNLEMQPIYDLAKVDVNELAYLQVRFRDGLPFARSEFYKFLKGENQNES